MNKVVLDTNVLVSALLANGPPAVIADMIAGGKIRPFYHSLIIEEYWEVLRRPKFGFPLAHVTRLIDDIMRVGFAVDINIPSTVPMTDEDDRVFYDTANVSGAFLITGNIKHFPRKRFVVTPSHFLQIYYG